MRAGLRVDVVYTYPRNAARVFAGADDFADGAAQAADDVVLLHGHDLPTVVRGGKDGVGVDGLYGGHFYEPGANALLLPQLLGAEHTGDGAAVAEVLQDLERLQELLLEQI